MLHDLDLYCRFDSPALAHVHARLPWPLEPGSWQLTGKVRGPFTSRGHTLPSSAEFRDYGSEAGLLTSARAAYMLSRASVIDPCTWSPQSPHLYEVTVELLRDGDVAATERRQLALRNLKPQRNSLFLDGKRWVLRAIHADAPPETLPWWEAGAARVTTMIDDAWLNSASRDGVLTVIQLEDHEELDVHLLRQISRYASAALVVVPSPVNLPDDVRLFAPNLLLAQQASPTQPLARWPHAAWVEADDLSSFTNVVGSLELPIIAVRRGSFASLAEARAAIDMLQADLAPIGQFAGYVV